MPMTALGGLAAKLAAIQTAKSGPQETRELTTAVKAEGAVPQELLTDAADRSQALDTPADDSLFLLLESDPEGDSDEDRHQADLLDEFREMLRSDEAEDMLDNVDPDALPDDPEDEMPPPLPVGLPTDPNEVLEAEPQVLPGEVLSEDQVTASHEDSVFVAPDESDLLQLFEAFYRINKEPSDEQFHALADAIGVPYDKLEEALFKLIGDSLSDESVGEHEVD